MRIFINEVEYRGLRDYSISDRSGQKSTATFSVLKEDNPIPRTHMRIEFTQDDLAPIWAGFITGVETPAWSSGFESFILPLQAESLEVIFERRLVNDAFVSKFTHEIVDEIFDSYLAEEGLTKGTIEFFSRFYNKYVSAALPMDKVLRELGDAVGAVPKISPAGVFTFQSKSTLPEATPPTKIRQLRRRESGQLVTVQRLTGANEETSSKTVNAVWETDQTLIVLGYQISEITGVTINGSVVNVGILGVDDSDPTITFLYRFGQNNLVLNDTATVQPSVGDNVVVVYLGFYSIQILVENEALKNEIAMISGTSGKIEKLLVDTSVTTYADGENRAQGELDQFSEREQEVTLEYVGNDLVSTQPLRKWNLSREDLSVSGEFVVVERTITDFYDQNRVILKLKKRSIFSRAGTIFDKNDKTLNDLTVRVDDVVAKISTVYEDMDYTDEYTIDNAGVIFYPVSGGVELYGPASLDGFFPI